MSLFKRLGSKTDMRSTPSPPTQRPRQPLGGAVNDGGKKGSPSSYGSVKNNNQSTAVGVGQNMRGAKLVARPRSSTDPETCCEVFKSHWQQIKAIMSKSSGPKYRGNIIQDDIDAVIHYIGQMMTLLIEERTEDESQGPILQYMLSEDLLEKLLIWVSQCGEYIDKLKFEQLKMYDLLISQARQSLLVHKPIIRPLLKLLSGCAEHSSPDIEKHLILVLHQLSICLTQNTQLLELFFHSGADQGPAKFLIFSLLIPYVHREGHVGQQARDALLLIMALSSRNDSIGRYIAENSDFCPVLATGLSGLYSSLPRKLNIPTDDWHRLTRDDCYLMPDLLMFLNSLEFCNAVIQIAHSLVREQLTQYIYNGFLVPVLGPALHQDISGLPITLLESESFRNSMDEVIAATAYLDLFLRRITEPTLLKCFLKFILVEKNDEIVILDSLITRINSNSRLCIVSLSLFRTLVDLNCEDVMFQLVFKFLLPCTHVMVSQRRAVKEFDMYSKTAEKFLSMTPACCVPDAYESPSSSTGPGTPDSSSSRRSRSPTPDESSTKFPPGSFGSRLEHYETSYLDYLADARQQVEDCAKACRCWAGDYSGNTTPSTTSSSTPAAANTSWGEGSASGKESRLNDSKDSAASNTSAKLDDSSEEKSVGSSLRIPSQGASPQRSSEVKGALGVSARDSAVEISSASQTGSYADSVTSEADSALSLSSPKSETPPEKDQSDNRIDSPLNDNFDQQDYETFMLMLKRVKTPVEVCDNIEDSLCEMDSLLTEVKSEMSVRRCRTSSRTSESEFGEKVPQFAEKAKSSTGLEKPVAEKTETNTSKEGVVSDKNPQKGEPPAGSSLTSFNEIISKASAEDHNSSNLSDFDSGPSAHKALESIPQHAISNLHSSEAESAKSADIITVSVPPGVSFLPKPRSVSPAFTPTKYNLGTPNIGPFLAVLLNKLESMMQNSLYVNFMLSGLLTRLASYPQPLLRSFLLNHNLVFQPTVKSLFQVLGSVKHKVDCYSYTVDNFEQLLLKARRYLAWREEVQGQDWEAVSKQRSDSMIGQAGGRTRGDAVKEKKRGSSISDLLFRRSSSSQDGEKGRSFGKEPRLQISADGSGFRFINRKSPEPMDKSVTLKTKNAVYCALVVEEFLKELAAISQEQSVLYIDDGYNSN